MKSQHSTVLGFAAAHRRLLRPQILLILGKADRANAYELAGHIYRRRRAFRRWSPPACTTAEVVAVRRALRKLVAGGKVKMIGRYRRRKVFALGERKPQ